MIEPINILITAFNRPLMLEKSLAHLHSLNLPIRVWVSIDGPKTADDLEQVRRCEDVALASPIRELDVSVNQNNEGIYKANRKAIDRFFSLVEYGLILEDDLLISKEFLELMPKLDLLYRNRTDILSISAMNWTPRWINIKREGLRKSIFVNSTGWVTWRDRWSLFVANPHRRMLCETPSSHFGLLRRLRMTQYWFDVISDLETGNLESWAYRWELTSLIHGKYSLELPTNLCCNFGNDEHSTNTKVPSRWLPESWGSLRPNQLRSIGDTFYSFRADRWLARNHYVPWILRRIINKANLITTALVRNYAKTKSG